MERLAVIPDSTAGMENEKELKLSWKEDSVELRRGLQVQA